MRVGATVLCEATLPLQAVRLRRSAVYSGRGVAPGTGEPVVLVPGFLCDDRVLAPMHGWLRRLGYTTYGAGPGRNAGCGEATVRRMQQRVAAIAVQHARPVVLLGYSRGGQFARVLAARQPECVSGVVTLGTPSLDPRSVHLAAALPAITVVVLGALGAAGLMGPRCFRGACCAEYRRELAAPLPDSVPCIAIRSRRDAIVDHRFTPDAGAERVEVDCTHTGYIANADAYAAVADALRRFREEPITTTPRRTRGART